MRYSSLWAHADGRVAGRGEWFAVGGSILDPRLKAGVVCEPESPEPTNHEPVTSQGRRQQDAVYNSHSGGTWIHVRFSASTGIRFVQRQE
jgi:hypothetical protein